VINCADKLAKHAGLIKRIRPFGGNRGAANDLEGGGGARSVGGMNTARDFQGSPIRQEIFRPRRASSSSSSGSSSGGGGGGGRQDAKELPPGVFPKQPPPWPIIPPKEPPPRPPLPPSRQRPPFPRQPPGGDNRKSPPLLPPHPPPGGGGGGGGGGGAGGAPRGGFPPAGRRGPPARGRRGRAGPPGPQQPGPPPIDPAAPLGTDLDLADPTPEEVRATHPRLFDGLPEGGFLPQYKNPCWETGGGGGGGGGGGDGGRRPREQLECLPYAYILGLPKCGSSDLWERLNKHEMILKADRKEVRFFTRGEFSDGAPPGGFLPSALPLSDFTRHHGQAARTIASGDGDDAAANSIIVDGGPHTLWWSVQEPDGNWGGGALDAERPKQMPIPLLLQGLQPQAKMLITLAEPVRRMYSDYYFLTKNSVDFDGEGKSPEDFDSIAMEQMAGMQRCFRERSAREGVTVGDKFEADLPIYAEQSCAYDRYHFGRPGSGRICIGLYHAFLQRWFQVRHMCLRTTQLPAVQLRLTFCALLSFRLCHALLKRFSPGSSFWSSGSRTSMRVPRNISKASFRGLDCPRLRRAIGMRSSWIERSTSICIPEKKFSLQRRKH
jgi:hypothetical protein